MYEKVVIVGRLGNDPEMRFAPGGAAVTNFNVAVNRRWTNQDGTLGEDVTWFRVSAWRRLAETCNTFLARGRMVLVEGRVKASAYLTKEGEPAASLELTADNVRFLDSPSPSGDRERAQREDVPLTVEDVPF